MQPLQRFKYIDSLRGLAIILVIMHHSHPYFAGITHYQLPQLLENILNEGDKGVTLFFVMSAFTLCLSLNKRKQTEVRPLRNYFLRRLFRIVPLYYCAMIAVWIAAINTPGTGAVVANLFFLHGLSPNWINAVIPGGWSVGVEVLFYLCFPLLLNNISSTSAALYVTMFCMIIAKVATSIMFKHPLIRDPLSWGIFTYENIISQLPVFMTGICLYFFSVNGNLREPGIYKATFFMALLLIIHLLGGNLFKVHYLFALAFALLAFGLSRYPAKILVNNFAAFIGKISYSIYLVHLLVANLLVKYNWNHYSANAAAEVFIRFMIIFGVSTCIAWFTYRLIERPGERLGKLLVIRLEAKAEADRTKKTQPSIPSNH